MKIAKRTQRITVRLNPAEKRELMQSGEPIGRQVRKILTRHPEAVTLLREAINPSTKTKSKILAFLNKS